MKIKIFFFLTFIFCILSATAQYSVSGTVKDSKDNSPIPYATIALLHMDSSVVTGAITGNDGKFVMENVEKGDYLIEASFLGYNKEYRHVNIPAQNESNEILLTENVKQLGEVVIKGKRPFIVQQPDRYVVNVGGNITTAGKNTMETLKQIPGVLVVGTDISVIGKVASVYIDGRPTRVSGEQLESLLSSLQGDNIDRIEVITNPSSRYDAEGGAILNIKTKKGLSEGLNGTADAGYRQGRKDKENLGINLNFRTKKINVYGNYGVNRANGWAKIEQCNIMSVNGISYLFDQNSTKTSNKALYDQNYRAGIDYFINQNHTIGAIFMGSDVPKDAAAYRTIGESTITPLLNNVGFAKSEIETGRGNNMKQYNLNYLGHFSKPGQELNIDLDYARFSSSVGESRANEYFDGAGNLTENIEQLRNTNPQNIRILSAKADFTQPVGKGKIDFGLKTSQSHTDNDLLFEKYDGSMWINDPSQTNHFVYTEQIHAGYVNFSQSFGKFGLQAGLRAEYTSSKGDQKTITEINDTTYVNLFPTLYVNYRLSQVQTFNIGYRKSIIRPDYAQLNPFEYSMDAFSYEKGNPYLKPMIMDNFSLSYNNNKYGLMTMISYDIRHNQITTAPIQDTINIRYGLTRVNFGKYQHGAIMVNYNKSVKKFWMLNLMLMSEYGKNNNQDENGIINDHFVNFTGQMNNRFIITPTLSAELSGMYMSGQKLQYTKLLPLGTLNFGLQKQLLKNKLFVSLNINDLLNTWKMKMIMETSAQKYEMHLIQDNRWASLSIKYIFGSDKVKEARNRKTGVEDEKQRIQLQ